MVIQTVSAPLIIHVSCTHVTDFWPVKYVALLAFNKIVITHPFIVAQQEDVIMECIDNPDITIRVQALNLVKGMVSGDNLVSIVSRLMRQLKNSVPSGRSMTPRRETNSDDDAEAEIAIDPNEREAEQAPPLPDDYKVDVISRILAMCSQDNYNNLVDFEWYIDILTQLVRIAPVASQVDEDLEQSASTTQTSVGDVSTKIGDELRNVAVKVRAIRPAVVIAAELILRQFSTETATRHPVTLGALRPVAWIVGEYASEVTSAEDVLGHLLQTVLRIKDPDALASCLQATIKLFTQVTGSDLESWTPERKAKTSLLLARIVHVLEPLALHPNLEVQERAVEFTELLKLTSEAVSVQPASNEEFQQDPPLLLTQAIPSLFNGWELNSVALGAQQNVPLPAGLDLDEPIHPNLGSLLAAADNLALGTEAEDEFEVYYHRRPSPFKVSSSEPAINRIADAPEEVATSYQAGEESYLDADILARRKAERAERNQDDPFYIQETSGRTGTSTPIHSILQTENGPDLDIDSIPIMQLDLGKVEGANALSQDISAPRPKPRQRIVVAQDENLAGSGFSTPRNYDSENNSDAFSKSRVKKLKQSLLQVDSSNIGSLSLEGDSNDESANVSGYDYEQQKREEAEMAQAMKEVERLRLEMQRAKERIQVAQGVDVEGTVVKKRKKKVTKAKVEGEDEGVEPTAVKVKKKKKKKAAVPEDKIGEAEEGGGNGAADAVVKPKKKKQPKPPIEIEDAASGS